MKCCWLMFTKSHPVCSLALLHIHIILIHSFLLLPAATVAVAAAAAAATDTLNHRPNVFWSHVVIYLVLLHYKFSLSFSPSPRSASVLILDAFLLLTWFITHRWRTRKFEMNIKLSILGIIFVLFFEVFLCFCLLQIWCIIHSTLLHLTLHHICSSLDVKLLNFWYVLRLYSHKSQWLLYTFDKLTLLRSIAQPSSGLYILCLYIFVY